MLFHLPLRQTEGFVASLLRLMDLDLNAPDHTTLSRWNRNVLVPALSRDDDGPIHLIVDSTGLKIYGAGEWCSRKHRKAHERGGWRKLHIGVAEDGYVVAETLTQNTVDDADMLHIPPVQTDPRRQPPCEGVRGAATRSDGWPRRCSWLGRGRSWRRCWTWSA